MTWFLPLRHVLRTNTRHSIIEPLVASCSNLKHPILRATTLGPNSTRSYAKKSKKSKSGRNDNNNNNDDGDDNDADGPVTTVIKTKGRGAHKSSVTISSSGTATAGEEPIDLGDVDAVQVYDAGVVSKMQTKMEKSVSWCQSVVFDGIERGSGRVTPALLDSVRVSLPDYPSAEPLVNVASVTVNKNALWVEVYDEASLKFVDSAINKANLPGISPVKHDNLTLRIPVARPTADTRTAIMKHINDAAEQAKQQIRIARTDALKAIKHKDGKKSPSGKDAQALTDKFGVEVDGFVTTAKKELAKV